MNEQTNDAARDAFDKAVVHCAKLEAEGCGVMTVTRAMFDAGRNAARAALSVDERESHTETARSVNTNMKNLSKDDAKDLLLGAATALESPMTTGWAPNSVSKLRELAEWVAKWKDFEEVIDGDGNVTINGVEYIDRSGWWDADDMPSGVELPRTFIDTFHERTKALNLIDD